MNTNTKKEVKFLVLAFLTLLVLVGGSIIIKFSVIDAFYLAAIIFFICRYFYIVKHL